MPNESDNFRKAIAAFDQANAADPHRVDVDGVAVPRELDQARRLSAWVERLDPDASEPARLAARCQHIRRWEVPRETFPAGRAGYLKWRTSMYKFHADIAAGILVQCGYDAETVARVRAIVEKRDLRGNPDAQLVEDALCLVFLETQAPDFIGRIEPAKMREILRKTWAKMSPRGREAALGLALPGGAMELLADLDDANP